MAVTLTDIQAPSEEVTYGDHKLARFVFTIELDCTTDLLDADRKTPEGLTEEQLLKRLIKDTENDIDVKNPTALDIFRCLDGWEMFDTTIDDSDGISITIVRSNVSLELEDLKN
jgi:hypothetical protein